MKMLKTLKKQENKNVCLRQGSFVSIPEIIIANSSCHLCALVFSPIPSPDIMVMFFPVIR